MRRIAKRAFLIGILLPTVTPALSGQALPSLPKFDIETSPIGLKGDVRPHQYLGVIGRAAAWLGLETGEAELWVHPLKLASDFQLDFMIPDYVEPVRGSDVARTVEVRPELTTITYSHATFTVRQHILAPVNAPGLIVLLDVDTFRPLDIVVSFKTVFQYAWPGSFGGQYAFWNDSARAFVLSESLRERNALIGSPWAARASTHPAHAMPEAPSSFVIPVDSTRAQDEFIPIVAAAAIASRDSVTRLWGRMLRDAETLYREKLEHVRDLIESSSSIDTPDDSLDLAFAWSKVNLNEAFVCNPDLGCGLVAGWGRSGTGTRPGFGWFFGGDAAINSFAMDVTGQWSEVAQGLDFLAQYQRDDGKIPHEISQAAGRLPWFDGTFPYTYYHADTTPYWIVAVWRYWRASGDNFLLDSLWPAVLQAYSWCLTRDTDDDGIIENGPNNLGAIEIGELGVGIHQDIYLAAVWIEALEAMQEMAMAAGDERLSRQAEQLHLTASRSLNSSYWRESEGHHAFGILQSGGTNDNLTVWPATAAAFSLLDTERAERTLVKLAADSISADWGARILSTGSALYDPIHYNNGAVWPFVTGFVTWGQYNYRRPWAAYPHIDAIKQATFDWARGRHPELMSGRYYRPLDAAVPQQFFATSMLITPLLSGMLGWEPDAPNQRARLAPQIPPSWNHLTVTDLRVGETVLDAEFHQGAGAFTATIATDGPPVTLDLSVSIPLGARDVHLAMGPLEGRGGGSTRRGLHDEVHMVSLHLVGEPVKVDVSWTGGLAVAPPTMDLEPGQQSRGLRVLDFRATDREGWTVTVEGEAGSQYALHLVGEPTRVTGGPATVEFADDVNILAVSIPPGSGRGVISIGLEATSR
jgi:glycogen debranching enzyme